MEKLEARLEAFIANFDVEKLCKDCAQPLGMGEHETRDLLNTYLNEAKSNISLITPYLRKDIRILEVGSGIGVLTAFLKSEGYDILGIEPGKQGGFSFMTAMHDAVLAQVTPQMKPEMLSIGASELDKKVHGTFDLIFSIHVMEHIFPLEESIEAMANVLTNDGIMRHLCPNYNFPFEPHLGIPLVPFFPKATRIFLPNKIKSNQAIWDGVNFVTSTRIKNLASKNGLKSDFERGVMAKFFERLQHDATFASRHQGLIGRLGKMRFIGKLIGGVFKLIPPALATPMIMTLSQNRK